MTTIIDALMQLLQEPPNQNVTQGLIQKAPVETTSTINPVPPADYDIAQNALLGVLGQLGGNGLQVNQSSTPMQMPVRPPAPVTPANATVTPPKEATPVIAPAVKAGMEDDGLNAGQRRVKIESEKADSVYRPSDAAVAAGASNNKVKVIRHKDGSVEFTNVGTEQYVRPTMVDPATQEAAPVNVQLIDDTVAKLKTIADPEERIKVSNGLSSSIQSFRDGIYNNYLNAQRATLGIDTMQDTLARAKQIDAQKSVDPSYIPVAAQTVMADMARKEEFAIKEAVRLTESNLTVKSLQNRLKLAAPEIALQETNLAFIKDQNQRDAVIAESFTPEMTKNLSVIFPEAQGNASALGGQYKRLNDVDKQFASANPLDIPRLAMVNPESRVGRTLLVDQLKSAMPQDDALRIADRMKKIMSDPKEMAKAGRLAGVLENEKSILAPYQGTNKEEARMHKMRQAELAIRAISREETMRFTETADAWLPVSDPGIEAAINKVRLAGLPANLPNVANAYVSAGATPEERRAKRARMAQVTEAAAMQRGKSAVGSVEVAVVMNTLPKAMTNMDVITNSVGNNLSSIIYPLGEDRKLTLADASQYPHYAPLMAGKNIARSVGGGLTNMFNWLDESVE